MCTDDNNSDNDNDEEEKVFSYTIIQIMGIKTLQLTKAKIRLRLGFKSGNLGDHCKSTVIL